MNTDYCAAIGPNDKSSSQCIVFVKCWSSAPVACVPHPQMLVHVCNTASAWIVRSQLSCLVENVD